MKRGAVLPLVLAAAGCGKAVVVELAPDAGPDASRLEGGITSDATADAGDPLVIAPYCEPAPPARPAACPPSEPSPGASCADPDLACVYSEDAGGAAVLAWDTCANMNGGLVWSSSAKTCGYDCVAVRDAGAATAIDPGVCTSAAPTACAPRSFETKQDVVDAELLDLAQGCQLPRERTYWVFFQQGCVTQIVGVADTVGACLASALTGRRLPCASEVQCAVASLSSLR